MKQEQNETRMKRNKNETKQERNETRMKPNKNETKQERNQTRMKPNKNETKQERNQTRTKPNKNETKQERNQTRTRVGRGASPDKPSSASKLFSHGKQTTAKDRLPSHVSSLIRTLSATNLYCRLKISEGIIACLCQGDSL